MVEIFGRYLRVHLIWSEYMEIKLHCHLQLVPRWLKAGERLMLYYGYGRRGNLLKSGLRPSRKAFLPSEPSSVM